MKLSEIFKKAAAGGRTSLTRAADDKERVKRGEALLGKYRAGKVNLDRRIVENEQWYKMRRTAVGGGSVPSSGWLFNAIANKHAEAMDNYPSPVILPREESDRAEAEALSAIVPVILDRCDFEQVFYDHGGQQRQQPCDVFHFHFPPVLISVAHADQSFRPELAMVSRIRLWDRMKMTIGTIMTMTVTAAAWPVRAMPPAWICCRA